MTGIICALAGSGGSLYVGTATVTVGFASGGGFSSYGFDTAQGSISPANWASTGLPFAVLKDVYSSGSPVWLEFTVSGSAPNSGWSTLTVGGVSVNRADGSYTNSGGSTRWIFFGAPTLFGTSAGATKVVTWA